jgi:hypothetical protein
MGLDATVYCNCIRQGLTKNAHPFPEFLDIGEEGYPIISSNNLDIQMAHDLWQLYDACEHEDCILLHHHIGNAGLISELAQIVSDLDLPTRTYYPIILNQVLYSGTHCGDYISGEMIDALSKELNQLAQAAPRVTNHEARTLVKRFIKQFRELIIAAKTTANPIVF